MDGDTKYGDESTLQSMMLLGSKDWELHPSQGRHVKHSKHAPPEIILHHLFCDKHIYSFVLSSLNTTNLLHLAKGEPTQGTLCNQEFRSDLFFRTQNKPTHLDPILTMADNPSAAWPVADDALATKILDTVQQASHYRQLKKVSF